MPKVVQPRRKLIFGVVALNDVLVVDARAVQARDDVAPFFGGGWVALKDGHMRQAKLRHGRFHAEHGVEFFGDLDLVHVCLKRPGCEDIPHITTETTLAWSSLRSVDSSGPLSASKRAMYQDSTLFLCRVSGGASAR